MEEVKFLKCLLGVEHIIDKISQNWGYVALNESKCILDIILANFAITVRYLAL